MKRFFLLLLIAVTASTQAQVTAPEIVSWIQNLTGETGYNNIPSNVQQVQYSDNNVYVTSTCIPGYDIGPWQGNPNTPVNQNFCFKITRHPAENTGTKTATALGHTGVWTNGVSMFNAKDAMSYNNQNIWYRNAYYFEGQGFDECLGHPAPNGEYHHHVNPSCLYTVTDSSEHAPLIGYAFDGFPIYGAWGFVNVNGTGGITRMKSSYHVRNMADRTTLPDGTVLQANQYGPDLNTYPLGAYLEDYIYEQGYGDLDEYNGRFCVTPDYPAGVYAYFVTIDDALDPIYPYTIGPKYYGTVQAGNTGPQSAHNVPSEAVVTYIPDTNGTIGVTENLINKAAIGPNPASDYLLINFTAVKEAPQRIELFGIQGNLIKEVTTPQLIERLPMYDCAAGVYFVRVTMSNGESFVRKMIKG